MFVSFKGQGSRVKELRSLNLTIQAHDVASS